MRAVTMPQFLTGKKPTHWLSGLPFTVPQPNQQTHACPPAKPGRNTLLSAPVTHHPQILIQKPPSSSIRVDIFSSVVFLCRILLQKLDRTSLSFCTWIVLFLVVFFFFFLSTWLKPYSTLPVRRTQNIPVLRAQNDMQLCLCRTLMYKYIFFSPLNVNHMWLSHLCDITGHVCTMLLCRLCLVPIFFFLLYFEIFEWRRD